MDFKLYYRQLDREQRKAFANRAQTSTRYIENHLMFRRRIPRPDMLERLAAASQGKVSYGDLVTFFYQEAA